MQTFPRHPVSSLLRLLGLCSLTASLLAVSAGCGSETDDVKEGASPAQKTVNVPTIEGDVAQADFCALHAQIYCAANVGCCTQTTGTSGSEQECLASAPCPLVPSSSASVVYDAKAAGDFLREEARSASTCSLSQGSSPSPFLGGTGAEGAACQLGVAAPQCASGLECGVAQGQEATSATEGVCLKKATSQSAAEGAACEDGGGCASGRCAGGVCSAKLADGAACTDASDCSSGRCSEGQCGASGDGYCAAAPEDPPSNADWSDPTELCLTAHNASDAGTSASIRLAFLYDGTWYPCDLVGGIKQGEEKCCTAQKGKGTFTTTASSSGDLYVQMNNGDGLRFTNLKVKKGSSTLSRGTYRGSSTVSCVGCSFGSDCESCWVDSDGHDDCAMVRVPMTGSAVNYCYNYLKDSTFLP